jgi:hypothetical protein
MSHLAFLSFDIFSHSTLGLIQHLLPSTFFTIQYFVPIGISYFWHYFYLAFCPIQGFVLSTFFTLRHFVQFHVLSFDVFYRRRFLLRHFISEPIGQCESLSYLWPLIRQEHYFFKQNTNEILLNNLWFNLFGWLAGRWPSSCRCMAAAWGTPPPRPPNGTTDREG